MDCDAKPLVATEAWCQNGRAPLPRAIMIPYKRTHGRQTFWSPIPNPKRYRYVFASSKVTQDDDVIPSMKELSRFCVENLFVSYSPLFCYFSSYTGTGNNIVIRNESGMEDEMEAVVTAPWWVWLILSIIAGVSFWCQAVVTEERYAVTKNLLIGHMRILIFLVFVQAGSCSQRNFGLLQHPKRHCRYTL